ncbi:MAG: serine O-acetyltransferase [Proteobacteria bacterium]|jgi:serine O-acetyltransferase|nr:serine O-acetyltransferase [Pseudomonadota bacterium]
MSLHQEKIAQVDPIWFAMRERAEGFAASEPAIAILAHATILQHDRLEDALAYLLASKIGDGGVTPLLAREVFEEVLDADPEIGAAVRADLSAVFDRDPACHSYAQAFLFFKGFHALQSYRIAHWLFTNNRAPFAYFIQSRMSELFAVDIHPNAKIGRGILMDHATGIVVGETAVVEDDVSMLHGVTLGGTGKEHEDRHPKIRRGVLLGAGAKVLGNIEVGEYSRVAAGSVVLKPVPAHCTVAGVPAKTVGCAGCDRPSQAMDHVIREADFDI